MDTLHPKSHRGVGKRRSFNMKSTLDVVWNQDTFPSPVLDLLGIGLEYTFRPFDRCLYCLLLGKSRRKRTESLDMARILEASFVQGANQIKNSVPRLIDSNPQRNEKKVGGEVDSLYVIITHKVETFDYGPKEYRCFSHLSLHALRIL